MMFEKFAEKIVDKVDDWIQRLYSDKIAKKNAKYLDIIKNAYIVIVLEQKLSEIFTQLMMELARIKDFRRC